MLNSRARYLRMLAGKQTVTVSPTVNGLIAAGQGCEWMAEFVGEYGEMGAPRLDLCDELHAAVSQGWLAVMFAE